GKQRVQGRYRNLLGNRRRYITEHGHGEIAVALQDGRRVSAAVEERPLFPRGRRGRTLDHEAIGHVAVVINQRSIRFTRTTNMTPVANRATRTVGTRPEAR